MVQGQVICLRTVGSANDLIVYVVTDSDDAVQWRNCAQSDIVYEDMTEESKVH